MSRRPRDPYGGPFPQNGLVDIYFEGWTDSDVGSYHITSDGKIRWKSSIGSWLGYHSFLYSQDQISLVSNDSGIWAAPWITDKRDLRSCSLLGPPGVVWHSKGSKSIEAPKDKNMDGSTIGDQRWVACLALTMAMLIRALKYLQTSE